MRRKDREITDRAEIDAIIRGAEVCRLAFAVDDEPYLVPVSFGYDGAALYFHTAKTGRKIDCIAANPRVCFEVEGEVELVRDHPRPCDWTFSYESVVGYGTVSELVADEDRQRGLDEIMRQYGGPTGSFQASAVARTKVWRLEVESVTGKRAAEKPRP